MLGHYFTIALRSLRRAPLTATVNVVALALGLASFVIAYGIVTFWDKSERHFPNVDRTYVVTADLQALNGSIRTGVSPTTNRLYADYLKAEFTDLEAVARTQTMSNEGGVNAGDVNERMFIVGADAAFLEIFDLPFVKGDAKNALRDPNSVVITQDAAKRLFGTDDVLDRTITLGSVLDVTVKGVIGEIPEPSYFGHSPAATVRFDVLSSWDTLDGIGAATRARDARRKAAQAPAGGAPPNAPSATAPPQSAQPQGALPANGQSGGQQAGGQQANGPAAPSAANAPPPPENWLGNYCCTTYIMLALNSKLTAKTLSAQLKAFGERHVPAGQAALVQLDFGAEPITSLIVAQLNGQLLPGAPVSITTVLLVLGGLVLAVACVNYANLATAQAVRRAREVGLRKALGAGRYRVMAQYLAEAGVLAAAAAAFAFAAVALAAPALHEAVGVDLTLALGDNVGFWIFVVGLLAAVTLAGGAYPAFVLSRVPPVVALRVGRTRLGPRFAGMLLVGLQFAAASFLMIVVLVMFAQSRDLERTGLGSTSDPIVVVSNFQQFSGVDSALLHGELARLPQVTAVGETASAPWTLEVSLIGFARTPEDSSEFVGGYINTVGYDYFSTLGIRILAGRAFDREHADDAVTDAFLDASRTPGAIIDESLSRQLGFATPQDAVDQVIYVPERITRTQGEPAQPTRVVGVVENKPLHLRGSGTTANVYYLRQNLPFKLVRVSARDVPGGLAAIDALWKRLSPQTSISRKFMDDMFNQNYENFARISQVFGGLAFLAVAISVIGLFGMAIQVVGRRVHEIGVRKSVGARTGQIVAMLLGHFSKPVVIANLVAWPLGYLAAQKYLEIFSHRVPLTPVPFLLSLGLALAVAWAAVVGQALRAARVSPATVLRAE